jgi:hypothetical protein
MLSLLEVEQFISDTFNLCFEKKCAKKGHVQNQQQYLLGCIETLHRRGDISEEVREFYRFQYYEGLSLEESFERVFGELPLNSSSFPIMAGPDNSIMMTESENDEKEDKIIVEEVLPPILPGSINEAINGTNGSSPHPPSLPPSSSV